MKAITIWQPWASLIIIGAKPYEFRGRSFLAYIKPPQPGERIAIHAALRPVRRGEVIDLRANLGSPDASSGLIADRARPLLDAILDAFELTPPGTEMRAKLQALCPPGAVLGTAVIGEPIKASEVMPGKLSAALPVADGSASVIFSWAWPLTGIESFTVPVPASGMQGFWEWRP